MMMRIGNPPIEQNGILACLPARERKTLREYLEPVSLRSKEQLNEVDSQVRYLHFPVDSAISLMDSNPEVAL
jgi:hypothetical protein